MARPEKEPETELAKRLRAVRKALGDEERGRFAMKLEIPKNTLAGYETGISEAPTSIIEKYNSLFGVDIPWLVTGKGEMFASTSDNSQSSIGMAFLNKAVMKAAIEAVDIGLNGRSLPSDKKAELILVAYDLILKDNSYKDSVIRLVRAA